MRSPAPRCSAYLSGSRTGSSTGFPSRPLRIPGSVGSGHLCPPRKSKEQPGCPARPRGFPVRGRVPGAAERQARAPYLRGPSLRGCCRGHSRAPRAAGTRRAGASRRAARLPRPRLPPAPPSRPAPAGPASGAGRRPRTAREPGSRRLRARSRAEELRGLRGGRSAAGFWLGEEQAVTLSPSSELIHRKKMCPKSLAKGVEIPRVVVQGKNEVWASVAGNHLIA